MALLRAGFSPLAPPLGRVDGRSNVDWRLLGQSGAMRARDGLLSVSARTRRVQPAAWAEHLMLFALRHRTKPGPSETLLTSGALAGHPARLRSPGPVTDSTSPDSRAGDSTRRAAITGERGYVSVLFLSFPEVSLPVCRQARSVGPVAWGCCSGSCASLTAAKNSPVPPMQQRRGTRTSRQRMHRAACRRVARAEQRRGTVLLRLLRRGSSHPAAEAAATRARFGIRPVTLRCHELNSAPAGTSP